MFLQSAQSETTHAQISETTMQEAAAITDKMQMPKK